MNWVEQILSTWELYLVWNKQPKRLLIYFTCKSSYQAEWFLFVLGTSVKYTGNIIFTQNELLWNLSQSEILKILFRTSLRPFALFILKELKMKYVEKMRKGVLNEKVWRNYFSLSLPHTLSHTHKPTLLEDFKSFC